jgi:hypothetical protein
MARRMSNTSVDGLRELLIRDRQRSSERWALPSGRPDDFLEDLRAHVPVCVSAAQLMRALSHAGLPHADYCCGGKFFKSLFVLDERGELLEAATVLDTGPKPQ